MVSIAATGIGGVALGVALLAAILGVLYAVVRLAVRHALRETSAAESAPTAVSGVRRVRDMHRKANPT